MQILVKVFFILFAISFASCSVNHYYQANESKHSLRNVHLKIIFDYLQHVRKDCNGCTLNINDVLNHENDYCSTLTGALEAGDNDINDQINLLWFSYQLHGFGTVKVCPQKFECKDMYRFTHLIHNKKENTYSGEVRIEGKGHFLFFYRKVGDDYILMSNREIDSDCN